MSDGIIKQQAKEFAHSKYKGFSDFMLHASLEEKKKVIAEAAHKSNEDQMKVFQESKLKLYSN
ncbi:MAG TPA: hypothetical protein VEC13_01075 [Candidatus Paceibacterota bacterium]|nr:hypothetical protein [Candidatus Paceibacterota bacterium]